MPNQEHPNHEEAIRTAVRDRYAAIANRFASTGKTGCCGSSSGDDDATFESQVVTLYETPDAANLPEEVTGLSLGCGDPVTLASLVPGQTVLDLGSGGGIDCFLAAQQVGETGHVIGVDMTPAMLDRARENAKRLGVTNVEFRLGEIEHLPVADETVDVILSNCVINLSPDKPQVFREAFRVLRPGGRLAVSDMVTSGPLAEEIKQNLAAWAGCLAGAMDVAQYVTAIEAAGFIDVQVEPVYLDRAIIEEAVQELALGDTLDLEDEALYETVFSARVTARKPDAAPA